MIKRFTLLCGAAMAIAPVFATSGLTEPSFVWGNFLTGTEGQDQSRSVVADGTDAVYWYGVQGTGSQCTPNGINSMNVTYGGDFLYEGADYIGTSSNKNMSLLKTNAAGEKEWVIYSNAGDFSSGEGGVAVNSQGNLVIFGCVRHTDGFYDKGVNIVDATGASHQIGWEVGESRYNRLFLATATPDGKILWAKTFEVSTEPAKNASGIRADFTADAVNAYAVTVDADDNIYIGGRYRNPLTFTARDGSEVVLEPKNVSSWNGDPQVVCGDMYVVKLDSDGNYLTHLSEGGNEVSVTYCWNLTTHGGKIYMAGYAKGADSFTLGGVELNPVNYVCPVIGCLDTDLTPEWIHLFPGGEVGGKNAVQNVGLSVTDNNIWFCGQYNGKICDYADESNYVASTQGNMREGFLLKLSADGKWIKGANSRTDFNQNMLTGYLNVIADVADRTGKVLVYGYAMNATVGVFLRSYDAETLQGLPDESWSLLTQGGVPTCTGMAYVPELATLYVEARGNKAFLSFGGVASDWINGYTNYLARFDLPLPKSTSTSVESIDDLVSDTCAPVYYDLCGFRVDNPERGKIYICRRGAKVSKEIMR